MKYAGFALMFFAGAAIGVITPHAFGKQGWKFWLGLAAVIMAELAGIMLA